jgi:uncharacterized membrane protein
MTKLLFDTCPAMLWVITIVQIVFTVMTFVRFYKTKNIIYFLTGLLTIGLTYDGLILALGCFVREGEFFAFLSRLRYILHGALIPFIYIICAYALDFKGKWLKAAWIFTAIFVILGFADGCVEQLALKEVANVTRYISVYAPAWAELVNTFLTFGTVVPMMIAGVIVWKKQKTPYLFLSGALMFLFSGLGVAVKDLMFYISMYGELLMALFLYLYARKKDSASNNQ